MYTNRILSPSLRPKTGRLGFTLLELLVVIAIIALLVAILLPALESSRREGKKSTCLSNMKSIATTSKVYEADDPNGFGIPVHSKQYSQDPNRPIFIGAYEWGGKSGIGRPDQRWVEGSPIRIGSDPLNTLKSKYGTAAGFGPATRPLNVMLYPGGFREASRTSGRATAGDDTRLDLPIYRCPSDDGPPKGDLSDGNGPHCAEWIKAPEVSSYDFFGNSYAANLFMIGQQGGGCFLSNSPYLRPLARVPTPQRTLFYEENIGRWAWAAKNELTECLWIGKGVDPGPTKALRGWHNKDWTFNRVFVDSHGETQTVLIPGTEDAEGYSNHYRNEVLPFYPPFRCSTITPDPEAEPENFQQYQCIIVRGPGWQKDTFPSDLLDTKLQWQGKGRPSYEDCVQTEE